MVHSHATLGIWINQSLWQRDFLKVKSEYGRKPGKVGLLFP
jgi:hypothetical protein